MNAVIKINGKKYDFFTNLTINLNHGDLASSFSFSAFYDPTQPAHREIFRPFTYSDCVIETEEGQVILTGTILSHKFGTSSQRRLATLSGYSKTGVLIDSTIAAVNYPLEKTELTLAEVARELCDPFGIPVTVSRDANAANEKFAKVVADPTETVGSFLTKLAAQKNLVLNHDVLGNLFIELISTFSTPVAFFEDGQPGVEISLDANGQALHSEITVMKQASTNTDNAAEASFSNPYVDAFRPLVKKQSSGSDNNTADAAKNSVLAELRNGLKLVIKTDRWEWVNNSPELIIPNRLISVKSPDNFLFNQTKMFVDSVVLQGSKTSETAILTCIIPEIFQGGSISNIFV